VFEAAETPIARMFLGFSRFPAARSFVNGNGTMSVQFTDLRFLTDLRQRGRGGRSGLFTATVHFDADGSVTDARIGP
jgi:hypothetical protein